MFIIKINIIRSIEWKYKINLLDGEELIINSVEKINMDDDVLSNL